MDPIYPGDQELLEELDSRDLPHPDRWADFYPKKTHQAYDSLLRRRRRACQEEKDGSLEDSNEPNEYLKMLLTYIEQLEKARREKIRLRKQVTLRISAHLYKELKREIGNFSKLVSGWIDERVATAKANDEAPVDQSDESLLTVHVSVTVPLESLAEVKKYEPNLHEFINRRMGEYVEGAKDPTNAPGYGEQ